LRTIGVEIVEKDEIYEVMGTGGVFKASDVELYAGNAGTTVRFLTALCSLIPGTQRVTGDQRMQERPINDLVEGLKLLGVEAESTHGCPPVTIRSHRLKGGKARIRGEVSSQFISALLMVASYAEEDVELTVEGDLVSKPYVDLTIGVMRDFGAAVERNGYQRFFVSHQARYKGQEYEIEADLSSAGYWFALAAITGSTITVKNVRSDSQQADRALLDLLEKMGCKVSSKGMYGVTLQGPPQLHGLGTVDLSNFPDSVMTLAVVSACAEGETKIVNVETLRYKESDRLEATACELRKVGIQVDLFRDGLSVYGGDPHAAEIETYADHRIAMSFGILGKKVPGIVIRDPGCVSKTYPTFFEELERLTA
ncbi:MAG: 3-phosphoshikimate 1-carboxyvinyltransferase, partial [Candidatus Tectomicrobia bacterium]|nr:3-phosphoshikimate 1-carboxyvinyltransferase [Candidatus Tectomicrobia bacterium]